MLKSQQAAVAVLAAIYQAWDMAGMGRVMVQHKARHGTRATYYPMGSEFDSPISNELASILNVGQSAAKYVGIMGDELTAEVRSNGKVIQCAIPCDSIEMIYIIDTQGIVHMLYMDEQAHQQLNEPENEIKPSPVQGGPIIGHAHIEGVGLTRGPVTKYKGAPQNLPQTFPKKGPQLTVIEGGKA